MRAFQKSFPLALLAVFFGAASTSSPAAAERRCKPHVRHCAVIPPARIIGDLPFDSFIPTPAAPYSYYTVYPVPYPYVYATHGCIVRSGIYDWASYFKGYQVLRVAC
jgi:hypothetical protein